MAASCTCAIQPLNDGYCEQFLYEYISVHWMNLFVCVMEGGLGELQIKVSPGENHAN